jgi:hypothetical protein
MWSLVLSATAIVLTACAGDGGGGSEKTGGVGGSASGGTGGSRGGTGGNGGNGAGGQGGGAGACDPGADGVCVADGKAVGVMGGFGFVSLGKLDTVTSPTCDSSASGGSESVPITKAAPCTGVTKWSSTDGICVSGTIPALPGSPAQSDYDNNWGIQVGFDSSAPAGQPLGAVASSFKTITLTVSGSPQSGLRAEIHRLHDSNEVTYCANMTSGKSIALSAFSTQCYGGSNDVKLKEEDLPNIDKIGVQVSSGNTAISVDGLCLTKLSFGR